MPRNSWFLDIGPFVVHLNTRLASVRHNIERCYDAQILATPQPFADFHVRVDTVRNMRRVIRPQCQFWLDGKRPFKPLPVNQAPAFFEWGLNWCIGQSAHQYLQLHAAVVEKNGKAAIFVGAPGSGKSTLCAALTLSGWRLLSDEFALIATDTLQLSPLPRPVSLKNESIDLIRKLTSDAEIGPVLKDTRKGTVGHLKQPRASVQAMSEPAQPRWLIFPSYTPQEPAALHAMPRARAVMRAADQAFNYGTLGMTGFNVLCDTAARCDCYELTHNDLNESLRILNNLANDD